MALVRRRCRITRALRANPTYDREDRECFIYSAPTTEMPPLIHHKRQFAGFLGALQFGFAGDKRIGYRHDE